MSPEVVDLLTKHGLPEGHIKDLENGGFTILNHFTMPPPAIDNKVAAIVADAEPEVKWRLGHQESLKNAITV
jgi:hypothetical protein